MDSLRHQASAQDSPLARISACLIAARDIPGLPETELAALDARAAGGVFNLLAVGEFKRGKSSLLNALLGADILPVGVIPLTAIATILSYGEQPAVEVQLEQGGALQIALRELADYVTEKGNPHNVKGIREVHITWPSTWLARGVRLIDTPGIGSVYRHNSDVTYRYLPRADAVLFLLSADQPVGQAETEFLQHVRDYAGRLFFLLNKCDLLTASELAESQEFTERTLAAAVGRPVPVFPVSARWALEVRQGGDPARFAASGFPAFSEALARFLDAGKGEALATALAKGLRRLVAQARLHAELARASLRTPLAELREKIAAFEARRQALAQDRRDFVILLKAEVGRLAGETVAAAVAEFNATLIRAVEQDVDARFRQVRHLPLRALDADLQETAIARVRDAWDEFRNLEDTRISEDFQGICQRFAARIEATVDELYRSSSELFALTYERIATETAWSQESNFYYRFSSEPAMLSLLGSALMLSLPKFLGDDPVWRRALAFARDLADRQAGRVRYDFVQRLERSQRAFETAMLERLDATLAGIESAMSKGLAIGTTGDREAARHGVELNARLKRLDQLGERLRPMLDGAHES